MNKKGIVKTAVCIAIAIISIMLCACSGAPSYKRLSAPKNLRVENGVLVWDEVKHAVGYAVYKENDEYLTEKARFDLSEYTEVNTVYELYVIALGDGNHYMDSEEVMYSYTYTPPEIISTPGLAYKLLADGTGYEVSRGLAKLNGNIVIPDYYEGLPVKRIAKEGFWKRMLNQFPETGANCNKWTTGVRFPQTLEEIGEEAFACCIAITEFNIPESVVKIEKGAFYGCVGIKSIKLPPRLTEIPDEAFEDCDGLEEITLPNGLKKIGDEAFHGNHALLSITIPDSVTEIGVSAFQRCKSLTEIYIPDSVTKISDYMFCVCGKLADIRFPEHIEFFGKGVVYGTKWLQNQPDGIVAVQGYMCDYKGSIEDGAEIVIPSTVKHISGEAFYENKAEVSLIIPDGVTLGAAAFRHFRGLKSVRLPSDLTCIPDEAFAGCGKLEVITIPDSVVEIGNGAFSSCTLLQSFELPPNLKKLGKNIVTHLSILRIPESVTEFGGFVNCHKVIHIIMSPTLAATVPYYTNDRRIYITCSPEECEYDFEALYSYSTDIKIYLYVEYEQDVPDDGGNYWHYADDGKTPLVWER